MWHINCRMDQPSAPLSPPPDAPGTGGALPKSPAGGPQGPGGSPMMSPGAGAGNKAAAVQSVKAVMPMLLKASMAFEAGSKEQQALLRSISSLNPIFGKAEGTNMVPAGLAQMAMAAKQGPMSSAPPPGLISNNAPPPGMSTPLASEEAA
jgi:hypothetical protein